MVKRRRLFYGGGCQNPHHLESMGKYLQWNAAFFFTGSSALAKIVGPQEEDLHPWKRSHWSTPGSDSSDIQEGMVEDDEPHLDSSLDMTWQCVDDLENAKRLVVVHQFLDLCFFFALQIWSFCTMEAVWSAGGDNDFVRSICKLVLRPHLCWSFASVLAFQCVPKKKRWSAFGRKFAMFCLWRPFWNCNQTGYCCISLRIMWLSVMFIAFFVILLTCPRCPSQRFLTAQHTPLQFPGWCPSSGGRDSAVVSSSVDVVCVFLKFPAKTI